MNRPNMPKSPRFPDFKAPAETFNRAMVEIIKQNYKEIVGLRERVNALETKIESLEMKNIEGQRPSIRYSLKESNIN